MKPSQRGQFSPSFLPRFSSEHPARGFANCTGMHAAGSDQKWTTKPAGAACRLTVPDGRRQPRRYWEIAPELFLPDVLTTPKPCPFSTDAYQLMRNMAFASEWAKIRALRWYGFLVALVDAAPSAHQLRDRVAAFKGLLKPDVRDRVGVISYEQLADVLNQHGDDELASWVRTRLAAVFPR